MMKAWLRLAGVLLMATAPLLAQGQAIAQATNPSFALDTLDSRRGALDINAVARLPQPWQNDVAPSRVVKLSPDSELWVRVRLETAAPAIGTWQLQYTLPTIDEVVFFTPGPSGWTQQRAGDRVPVSEWPLPGRYARFALPEATGAPVVAYLRVRSAHAVPLAVRVLSGTVAEANQHAEYLWLGIVLGSLLLLVGPVLVLGRIYRQPSFAWYAAYATMAALALFNLSGAAAEQFMDTAPDLARRLKLCLIILASATNLMLVHTLCRAAVRAPRLAVANLAIAGVAAVTVLAAAVAPVAVLLTALAPIMASCALAMMATAVLSWRSGDRVGLFAMVASLPLLLMASLTLSRMLGLRLFEFNAYMLSYGVYGMAQPFLLIGLYLRSRGIHTVMSRASGLATTDAVTGTLAPHMFHDRLGVACELHRKKGVPAAVLYVRLANLPFIRETLGPRVAEQSVIRSAIKLRRALTDADTVARVDESTFGVIFEFATARDQLAQQCARLVAHGLMTPQGLQPAVVLQFHVVVWLLAQRPAVAQEIDGKLQAALTDMAAGTRRPIRFVEGHEAGAESVV